MLVDSLAADAARGNGSHFSLFSWEHSQGILGRQWLVSVADTVRYTHVGLSPGSCSNTDLQRGEKSLRSNGVGPELSPAQAAGAGSLTAFSYTEAKGRSRWVEMQ